MSSLNERTRARTLQRSLGAVAFAFAFAAVACSSTPGEDDDGGMSGSGGSGGPTGGTSSGGSSVGGTGGSGAPTGGVATGGTGLVGGAGQSGSGGTAAGAGGAGNGGTVSGGAGSGGMAGTPMGGNGGGGSSNGGAGSGGRAGGGAGGAGAGGNGGAGAGGGGASGFSPCPATGACKILPLGDSITDGVGVSGGGSYRIELFRLALMAQKEITYVGSLSNGPQMVDMQMFPRDHEGHSGWTISQIDGITPSYALDDDPHIILLHIGTNDMRGDVSMAANRLGTLIDQIVTDQPNALVVVAKIIPYPAQSNQVTTYNNAVPGVVQMRASAGKHVVLVDQFTGFPTMEPNNELADGIHPNAAGYERMAGVWYAAISQYLH